MGIKKAIYDTQIILVNRIQSLRKISQTKKELTLSEIDLGQEKQCHYNNCEMDD